MKTKIIVLMGVCGSGKTTIGKELSSVLNLPFFDADDFHPPQNKAKMKSGKPLVDHDRLPWLSALNRLGQQQQRQGMILACSALREIYREQLSHGLEIDWFYLKGNYELILQRLEKRLHHFMPHQLLKSQFSTLEEPDYGVTINIDQPVDKIVNQIKRYL